MTASVGVGQFIAWNGGCLFIGRHDSQIPVHAHQALQLVVGRTAQALVRASNGEPWTPYDAAVIASRQPHSLDVTASDFGAVLFVEPETREGRAITERYLQNGIMEVGTDQLTAAVHEMFDAWLGGQDKEGITRAARRVIGALARDVEPSVVSDPRILSAIEYINDHLDETITLDAVASHACLSPSRFRHLFVEQTSMGLRPYVLWRRFLLVWDLLMSGQTLSMAAHSAGFADAAHLARTSKRTFGFAPSAMQVSDAPPPAPAKAAQYGHVQSRTSGMSSP